MLKRTGTKQRSDDRTTNLSRLIIIGNLRTDLFSVAVANLVRIDLFSVATVRRPWQKCVVGKQTSES